MNVLSSFSFYRMSTQSCLHLSAGEWQLSVPIFKMGEDGKNVSALGYLKEFQPRRLNMFFVSKRLESRLWL